MLLGLRSWLLGLLEPSVRNGLLCSETPSLRGLFDVVGYECGSHRSILGTKYKAISHEDTLPYLSRYQMSTSIQPLSRRETNSCSFSGNASPYTAAKWKLSSKMASRAASFRGPGRFPIPEDLNEDNHGFLACWACNAAKVSQVGLHDEKRGHNPWETPSGRDTQRPGLNCGPSLIHR